MITRKKNVKLYSYREISCVVEFLLKCHKRRKKAIMEMLDIWIEYNKATDFSDNILKPNKIYKRYKNNNKIVKLLEKNCVDLKDT